TWRWAAGFSGGVHGRDDSKITAYANAGFYRDILNPMTAALGILGEAYVGTRGSLAQSGGLDSGARIGLFSPVSRLAFGADYNTNDRELDFFMSVIHPFQRGGLLVGGGALRVDYLPGRGNSFSIGLRFPLGQPFLGRTRARQDHVELPDPELPPLFLIPDPTLVDALSNVGELAHWVTRLTVPFNDQWDSDSDDALARFADEMRDLKAHMGEGGITARTRSPVEDVEAYHRALDRAFSIATSGLSLAAGESTPLGKRAAARAREVILDHVLLPYNRLLGQQKDPDSTRGLGTAASGEFYEWLTRDTSLDFEQLRATTWTFAQVLDVIEEVRESSSAQWEDSRFVWLPFQLALTPDQHDEQGELNTIVERVTGQSFTHGNKRWYIENDQFAAELTRMIREAEDYHVLWIHDFRGYDADGNPDEEGFKQVVSSYLPALIDRVEAYDSVGKIPQYMIFIDQMYFQANGGRLWLELLENPLHHEIDLPDGYEAWEDSIARLQTDLRFAVANSELMQSQSLHFPDGWIENVVKVHVNVTNPPDPSFWTPGILPFFMGLPDVVMRDHRKISFYDATEEDPYKGMAIYTGMGVGEHYVGASWEDRAIMMQGPVLLSLKAAARQLLYNQGFEEAEVPWELRPKPMADDYDRVVADTLAAQGADWGADMQLHNQIGYRFKAVTVFKATLYTLMPPGSVIKAPDSIWGSHLWGSMLLGHALRGGRVLMIAPAIDNAPSAGFPQMAQAQDVLTRAVAAGEIFEEEIAALGGLLKVGLYNTRIAVGDVPGKLLAFTSNLERTPWLRELYGFRPEVLRQIEDEAAELTRNGYRRGYAEGEAIEPPKLHLKANYFATREAWDALLSRPDVGQPIRTFFGELAEQNRALEQGEYRDFRIMERELIPPTRMLLADYIGGLSPEARSRAATFFSIGSHNQNNRSMASDGEVAAVVSGWSALQGLPDFLVIVGLSEWIDDLDELERLFPSYHGIQRRLSHLIRIVV
ncbi:MAG: hypothetical protein PVF19_08700, partial [Gemmatimonadota bacterium]